VNYSVIDENVVVGNGAIVGVEKDPNAEIVVLGREITVADGVSVTEGQKHENDIKA
jgi:carbonic anhydrase/acetyltransferase-like protein (isoleucine patch superfamily)